MTLTRRQSLIGFAAYSLPFLAGGLALAQDRGLPPAVRRALQGYGGAKVASVRIRRGAPTAQGFMYEVALLGPGRAERIIFVDPDDGRVLYETDTVGR